MSNSRQSNARDSLAVRAVSIGFSSGYHWRLGGTEWGVLVWASRGVISVSVDGSLWVVPPHQAVWVPPRVAHAVRMAGRGTLRQVYFAPDYGDALPNVPQVVLVGALLRELLRRACSLGTLDTSIDVQRNVCDLLMHELVEVRVEPLELRMPRDPRALRAAEAVRAAPSESVTAATIVRDANASVRTIERLFRAETGTSFGAWRQRARLVHAMTQLADGATVSAVGLAIGYASTSAFVAAFRATVGMTPGQYASATRNRGR